MEVINAICVPPTIEDVVEYTLNTITANYIHSDISPMVISRIRKDIENVLNIFLSGFEIYVDVTADNNGCYYNISLYLGNGDTSEVYNCHHIVEWAE